jgi:hypothetical protein
MATQAWAVASLGRPHELTPDSSSETSAFCGLRDFARRFNNHWIIGWIGYRTPAAHRHILLGVAA